MARIYKITAYIVDVGETYKDGEEWFKDAIQTTDEVFCPTPIEHESADVDWDDDLEINYKDCPRAACEAYFQKDKIDCINKKVDHLV